MSFNVSRGVIDLPIAGTKGAPKKFKDHSSDVEPFLQHYTKLCAKHNVTLPHERIQNITQYCSRPVREFLEGLSTFRSHDWNAFQKDIKEHYNADKDDKRFRIRDLERYVANARTKIDIRDLSAWRKYNRGYICIGGWLLEHHKITDDEHATYFWKGIPRAFRERLENRLMSQYPTHDISNPFPTTRVDRVAKSLLQRDRFDRERMLSGDEDDSSDDFSDSDSTESSTDSDSDSERKAKKKRKLAKLALKRQTKKSSARSSHKAASDSDEDSEAELKEFTRKVTKSRKKSKTPSSSQHESDVEQMVEQLNKMSLDDPNYAALYFCACLLNPLVKDIIPGPSSARSQTRSAQGSRFARDGPPHYNAANAPRMDRNCYGCGSADHNMYACPQLNDLLKQGVIKRDNQGRYVMGDGSRIFRTSPEEFLATAAIRQRPAQTHYIGVSSETEEEDEFNEVYPCIPEGGYPIMDSVTDEDDENYVYPVERTEKTSRTARKQQFDGVWPPARKAQAKKAAKPDATEAPQKENVPPKLSFRKTGSPQFLDKKPVEVRPTPTFDADDSDAFMDDNFDKPAPKSKPSPQHKERSSKQPQTSVPQPASKKPITDREGNEKRQPRLSDLQFKTNPQDIIKKVLHTPITLQVGDILGTSKELSHQMQEILKIRTVPRATALQATVSDSDEYVPDVVGVYAASLVPKSRGSLI